MPEWRALIRRRIAGLGLRPVDEMDIVEELAQHVEDRYAELRGAGATDADALGASLEELDGETLATELIDVVAKKAAGDG
jgi:hypothetical protein